MLTFMAFLGCAVVFAAALAFASLPLMNWVVRRQQMHVVRRAARSIGREALLDAFRRVSEAPNSSCSTPDPVLDQISAAAARNGEKLRPLGPALTAVFLLVGAALAWWLVYA